jgi:tetratricopeptide (TPR) repeat protein
MADALIRMTMIAGLTIVSLAVFYGISRVRLSFKRREIERAHRLYDECDYSEALQCAEKLKASVFQPLAYDLIGDCQNRLGNEKNAIEAYEKAILIDPSITTSHLSLGEIALKKSKYQEAITHFSEILAVDPEMVIARLYLAAAYKLSGNMTMFQREFSAIRNGRVIPVNIFQLRHLDNFSLREMLEEIINGECSERSSN